MIPEDTADELRRAWVALGEVADTFGLLAADCQSTALDADVTPDARKLLRHTEAHCRRIAETLTSVYRAPPVTSTGYTQDMLHEHRLLRKGYAILEIRRRIGE